MYFKILVPTFWSLDWLRFRRRLRTCLQIWGRLVGLPGPKRREKRSTFWGRKSGKSSRTSTFWYLEGRMSASGVSSLRSASRRH